MILTECEDLRAEGPEDGVPELLLQDVVNIRRISKTPNEKNILKLVSICLYQSSQGFHRTLRKGQTHPWLLSHLLQHLSPLAANQISNALIRALKELPHFISTTLGYSSLKLSVVFD